MMKKIRNLSITIILLLINFNCWSQKDSYYYTNNNNKVYFKVSNKKSVQFIKKETFASFINNKNRNLINYKNNVTVIDNSEIKAFQSKYYNDVFKISDVYITNDNLELIVFNEIVCKGNSDYVKTLIGEVSYEIISKNNSKRFIIKINDKEINIVNLSNKLYETGKFEYCYPNFISKISFGGSLDKNRTTSKGENLKNSQKINYKNNSFFLDPNDEFFHKQFYLKNTGQLINDGHYGTAGADINIIPAWDITKGASNVIIAVIDEGVTSNHPDLPNSRQVRLNGSNFSGIGGVNNPSATGNGNHGNACAGIIAAEQNNGEGISGISPLSKIMPIKIFGSSTSNDIADAIEFAYVNGANIISNSWGYNTSDPNFFPAIVDEIENAILNNTLVVFAAGNTANHASDYNGYVSFPANNSHINGLICVGASNRDDYQANYSPTNSLIEIVAPSHNAYPSQISGESFEVWTIDIPNNSGYNPCNSGCDSPRTLGELLPSSGVNYKSYTGRMGGTSASCPQVAAVASLMLSVNPNLTPIEIEDFLKQSADKVGGYEYLSGKSNEMGFGRLNAYSSLILSQSNSCLEHITITQTVNSGQTDNQSAQYSITATNIINSGSTVNYDAGTTVFLKPGFHAKQGSTFRGFIQGCSQGAQKSTNSFEKNEIKDFTLSKEKIVDSSGFINIYPNPTTGIIKISTKDQISNYTVTNTINKTVAISNLSSSSFEIDIRDLPKGIYFLRLKFTNGAILNKKIIKN